MKIHSQLGGMRVRTNVILSAVGLGIVGSLVIAAPVSAATTIIDVTDVDVVYATPDNFIYPTTYIPWEPEGPATFPSVVDANEGDGYVLQAYSPVLDIPEECTYEIVSFSVDVESLQTATGNGAQSGFFVGLPGDTVDGTTAEFDGIGTLDVNGSYADVDPAGGDLDGVLTLTLPEPITAEDIPFGWLGLFTELEGEGPLWQVNSVSYQVSLTCPDAVPAVVPTLAATGSELPTLAAFAGLVLLAGGGALTISRARRTR